MRSANLREVTVRESGVQFLARLTLHCPCLLVVRKQSCSALKGVVRLPPGAPILGGIMTFEEFSRLYDEVPLTFSDYYKFNFTFEGQDRKSVV